MSENKKSLPAISISQLSNKIKKNLKEAFPENFWLIGEISEFRVHSSGHAYLELIEKDEKTDQIKARMRATIWSYTYRMLRPYFEGSTGYNLEAGIKIMVSASLEFHKQYGLSINIVDIDPNYTIGDLARKKAEIIERLTREGVIDMNKNLSFPVVPQRIAIISSESAAGYGDFLHSLNNNPYDFHFVLTLFPSAMQGDKAVSSIVKSLENIYLNEKDFDVVVLVRGGGATTDMECFNDYDLALNLSQFPLPVITGIGHERDDTIADLVAFQKIKTPTGVAEFLIDKMLEFTSRLEFLRAGISKIAKNEILFRQQMLESYKTGINHNTNKAISEHSIQLGAYSHKLRNRTEKLTSKLMATLKMYELRIHNRLSVFLDKEKAGMDKFQKEIKLVSAYKIEKERDRLEQFLKMNNILDPVHILERGFSITYYKGKVLKSAKTVKAGDVIDTHLAKEKISSQILKKDKKNG